MSKGINADRLLNLHFQQLFSTILSSFFSPSDKTCLYKIYTKIYIYIERERKKKDGQTVFGG